MRDKFVFIGLTALIADYQYYADQEQIIDQWLEQQSCERQGMVLKFCNEKTKILFIMRWS
jgi:hypothetical protein